MEMEREGIREPFISKEPSSTYPVSRIGWGAVFAGFFIAVVTQILLYSLGIAVGLTAVGAEGAPPEATTIGWGAGIWTLLSSIISVFVGAWVAGRYTAIFERGEGQLQGALVWSLSLLFALWIGTMGVTTLMTGMMGVVGQAAQVGATVMGDQQIGRGAGQEGMVDREQAIQTLMNTANMSREQAEQAVDQLGLGAGPGQIQEQAQQAAETTARVGAAAAWWFFITALLSLGAAVWGGHLGFSKRMQPPRPART